MTTATGLQRFQTGREAGREGIFLRAVMDESQSLKAAPPAARRKAKWRFALVAAPPIVGAGSPGHPCLRGRQFMTFNHKLFLCLAGALIGLTFGCATNDQPFGDRTVVLIHNRSPKEIIATTTAVFKEKSFELKSSGKTDAVFEIKGDAWESLTWGGWDGGGTWQRAHVQISDYGAGDYLVEVNVDLVSGKGDAFFEDKHPITRRARKPYQEMLNEVQKRLQAPPA
jgi:hypothetical protein